MAPADVTHVLDGAGVHHELLTHALTETAAVGSCRLLAEERQTAKRALRSPLS